MEEVKKHSENLAAVERIETTFYTIEQLKEFVEQYRGYLKTWEDKLDAAVAAGVKDKDGN